jgi:hypothetical protein
MALRDLFIKIGVQTEGVEKIDAVEKSMKRAKESALDLGGALKALGAIYIARRVVGGIRDFVEGTIQQADALDHQAEALGLSTDQLQKYQYAASLVGVTTQQAAVGFRFLNRVVGEAEFGTKGALKTIGRLGIQIYDAGGKVRPTNEILLDFSDKLAAIPDQQRRTALAMSTLGRNGAALLPFLQKGSAALKEMMADVDALGGGFDREFIQQAHEMDVQQKRLAMGWRTMGVELMKVLLPAMKIMVDRSIQTVKNFIELARHTNFVKTALITLGATAVTVAAMIALAWAPEIAIFTALIAAVTEAYLIFDDFYTFLKGGSSIIGDSLENVGVDSKKTGSTILDTFKEIGKSFGMIGDGLKSFDAWMDAALPKMVQWAGVFAVTIVKVIDDAISGMRTLANLVGDLFAVGLDPLHSTANLAKLRADFSSSEQSRANDKRDEMYQKLLDQFNTIGKGRVAPGTGVAPAVPGLREVNPNYVPTADEQNPGRTTGGGAVVHETNNSVTVHVNAAGTSNPAAVGNAVAKGVREGLKNPDSTNRNTFDQLSPISGLGN